MPPSDRKSFDPTRMLRLPPSLRAHLYAADKTILRLEKLSAPATELDALLYPFEYGLRLLTYVQQLSPSRIQLLAYASRFLRRSSRPQLAKAGPYPGPSVLAILADVLTSFHTTLRLVGLLPLYAQLRDTPSRDLIALGQCSSLIVFQALENVAHSIDLGVLVPSSRLNVFRRKWEVNSSSRLWIWSNRFWLLGVSLGVVGMWRDAWVEKERWRDVKRAGEKRAGLAEREGDTGKGEGDVGKGKEAGEDERVERDRMWWRKLLVEGYWSLAILPGCVEGGIIQGFDDGAMGLFGLLAGWEDLKRRWDVTEAPAKEVWGGGAS